MIIKANSIHCAEFFRISRATLSDWARAGCPKLGRGQWNLAAVFQWREEHIVGKLEVRNDMAREKLRAQRAKAELLEMEAEVQRGGLIDRQTVADEFVKRTIVYKQDLLALPRRLAQWPDAALVAKKQARRMMETYSRPLPAEMRIPKGGR